MYHIIQYILSNKLFGQLPSFIKGKHAHITCVINQLTSHTFLRKIVVNVYLPPSTFRIPAIMKHGCRYTLIHGGRGFTKDTKGPNQMCLAKRSQNPTCNTPIKTTIFNSKRISTKND
jgi:hypothetical protein